MNGICRHQRIIKRSIQAFEAFSLLLPVSLLYRFPCIWPSNNMVWLYIWLYPQAESLGTKILDEDGLLELIRTKPGKKSKYEIAAEAEVSSHNLVVYKVILFAIFISSKIS